MENIDQRSTGIDIIISVSLWRKGKVVRNKRNLDREKRNGSKDIMGK